ncbi:HD domain-containing phosphohydrolase [Georgenia subflava]|uniref:HD domain-containing protein n=1 Tax=Georgenia subflava TaxID=1622177 RepID=A0A6N7EG08_9MICO|nr:HD domain-containing phosphohydrolase [Georgenia subflava]MPV35607.1 HD domain-containing protein [Georgenia subflava]
MIRLLGILGGLSGAMDLGAGSPLDESLIRSVVAVRLARAVGSSDDDARVVLYASLLEHLGCTAYSYESATAFGDDISVVRASYLTDLDRPAEVLRTFVPGVSAGSGRGRAQTLLAMARTARDETPPVATCEVARDAVRNLGLGDDVATTLAHVTARWDGKDPPHTAGEDVPLTTRIMHVAGTAVLLALHAGPEDALAELRRRSGRHLDPDVVAAFDLGLLEGLVDLPARGDTPPSPAALDPLEAALSAEPDPVRYIDDGDLAGVARTFGHVVDLKSPWLHGHSAAVADLAGDAAELIGLPDAGRVRIAGHVHDLGRIGVSSRIWAKRAPLTAAERDQARLHPYYTERILSRSPSLADVATIAAQHHERSDGSGYHRGLRTADLSMGARVLAAADRYRSTVEDRPHRAGLSAADAAAGLRSAAREGRLDPDAVTAVLHAVGHRRPARVTGVAGLTERQVEVLRLVTQGLTNRQIGDRLGVSPRTAEHHVQDIYVRIGVSTRPAAALFAMEHGLLEHW